MGKEAAGHKSVTLSTLGKRIVAETFKGIAKLFSLKLLSS
jgi:hypothetical protein